MEGSETQKWRSHGRLSTGEWEGERRGKERVTYKGVPIRLSADFSKETLWARRSWKEVFEVMKGKDLHPR